MIMTSKVKLFEFCETKNDGFCVTLSVTLLVYIRPPIIFRVSFHTEGFKN
jgi:hypothetical protein